MPTDLQLIDGLEQLRQARAAGAAAKDGLPPDFTHLFAHEPHAMQLLLAWLAVTSAPYAAGTPSPEQARAWRKRARQVLDPASAAAGHGNGAQPSAAQNAVDDALRAGVIRLQELKLWPRANGAVTPGELAKTLRRELPTLNALRALRLAQRLGGDVAVPEAALRRLLWRLGQLPQPRGEAAFAQAASELERLARLSGLGGRALQALLEWHTGGRGGDGGLCGTRPRCGPCPLRSACAWGKLVPAGALAEGGDALMAGTQLLEPVRRQVSGARQAELAELELLALLVPGGPQHGGVFALAENLLRRFGGLLGLERASVAELAQVRGVTRARAIQLKAALELGRRFGAEAAAPREPITGSADVWRAYRNRFRHLPQEHFVIVLLDAKNRILQDHIVSKGTLTGSLAHPREVFQQAVRQSAAGVILLHNHPSGDPTPSSDDRSVTRRLREAGEILGIKVLDHLVLGNDRYYSFSDEDAL